MQAHNKPVTKKNNKQLKRSKTRHPNQQMGKGNQKIKIKILWVSPSTMKTSFLGAEAAKKALMLSLTHPDNLSPPPKFASMLLFHLQPMLQGG